MDTVTGDAPSLNAAHLLTRPVDCPCGRRGGDLLGNRNGRFLPFASCFPSAYG